MAVVAWDDLLTQYAQGTLSILDTWLLRAVTKHSGLNGQKLRERGEV